MRPAVQLDAAAKHSEAYRSKLERRGGTSQAALLYYFVSEKRSLEDCSVRACKPSTSGRVALAAAVNSAGTSVGSASMQQRSKVKSPPQHALFPCHQSRKADALAAKHYDARPSSGPNLAAPLLSAAQTSALLRTTCYLLQRDNTVPR